MKEDIEIVSFKVTAMKAGLVGTKLNSKIFPKTKKIIETKIIIEVENIIHYAIYKVIVYR